MSETPSKDDELAGTEQPFVQHLMELRDRLVKAMIAIGVAAALLFFFPGPGELYDFLAAPLVAHLPKGATLIATSVISPFMVPLKILLMSAFLLALPFHPGEVAAGSEGRFRWSRIRRRAPAARGAAPADAATG